MLRAVPASGNSMNAPSPTDPEWNQLAFRRREAPIAARYSPGWPAWAWTVLAALATAWLQLRGAETGPGPMQVALAAGLVLAIVAGAWTVGYAVFRASGRAELVGPIAMALVATLAIGWPFARAAFLDNSRPEEAAELIGALRSAESGLPDIAHGSETDAAYVDRLVAEQLEGFDDLVALRYYAGGEPRKRVDALRVFQRDRVTPLIRYQLAFNRLERTGNGSLTEVVARMPQLRTDTADFLAAGDALRAAWKPLSADFDRQLAAASFAPELRSALRREFDKNLAPRVAPFDALVAANAQVVHVDLEFAEFLAARKRHWQEPPGGGLLADSQALLDQLESHRARGLQARRNAKIAFAALRDAELVIVRRQHPDKIVVNEEDFPLMR